MLEVEEKQVLELIEKVEKGMKSHEEICKLFDEAIRMIPRWIPASERLPELETYIYSVDVLFCDVERNIYVGYVNFETGRWKDRNSTTHLSKERVTHWMPLPEVPNGQT